MLTRKIASLVPVLTVMLVAGAQSIAAQDWHPCFTLASLKGSYSIVATYGANIAISFGKRQLDGDGNLTGTFLLNEPTAGSTTGQRSIVTGTQAGSITVNCDGTGIVTRVLTTSGVQANQTDDFVITESTMRDGQLIATTIVDAQRTPSVIIPGGIFVRRTWTRVP